LSDAQNDNDKIYSVIKATSTVQDGRSNGIVAPNPKSQQECLEKCLKDINVNDLLFIEAHGTGTKLGVFIFIIPGYC
jgi:acyl transferase domain-containing protein